MSRNRRGNRNLPARGGAPTATYERRQPNAVQYRDDVCFLYDLPIGDAGSGNVVRKNRLIYAQSYDLSAGNKRAAYNKKYVLSTVPTLGFHPDMCRYQFYHVKFYGKSIIRNSQAPGGNTEPIGVEEFQSNGLWIEPDITPTSLQGYIETDDGMIEVFDILGRREFDVYAQSINVGILAPTVSYDIFDLGPNEKGEIFSGIVEESLVGATVTPIVVNSGQQNDEVTRCATVPARVAPNDGKVAITVPPGARFAAVNIPAAASGSVTAEFVHYAAGVEPTAGDMTLAEIALVYGGQTGKLSIPDAPFIEFTNTDETTDYFACVTFTEEL